MPWAESATFPKVGNLRRIEKSAKERAKEVGKLGPPPEPEEGELITEEFQRAHYLELMMRWGGLWLIAMTVYFGRFCWLLAESIIGPWWASALIVVCGAWAMVYLWRLALAARRWVRIVHTMDAQSEDRRTILQRTRELDEREKNVTLREAALEDHEAEQHKERVRKAAAARQAAAKKRAQQAAELAEIARELEDDDGGDRP